MKVMKRTIQLFALLAAIFAMVTACDVTTPNPGALEGLWGEGMIKSGNDDIEVVMRFTPNAQDSTKGEFIIWYDGTATTEDDAGEFSVDYSVCDLGTYKVEGDQVVLNYDPEKVGVKLDEDDALDHAKELQEAGEEGSVEAIAEDFKDMFSSFLGEKFQKLFKDRNNGLNRHTFKVEGDQLTLASGDVNDLVLKRQEE